MKNSPVIVLTYGFSGEQRLQRLLERDSDLVCTNTTGILPACDLALQAWQRAEGPSVTRRASPLAVRSVRAMAGSMITAMAIRNGGHRWCEIATGGPRAAGSFLTLFPETRVICLHRSCEDFVYSVLNAGSWGVTGPKFAASVAAYPHSPVAAISSWWADRSRSLLEFEKEYSDSCTRLLFEDLVLDEDRAAALLAKFLGLDSLENSVIARKLPGDGLSSGPDRAPGCGTGFPVAELPPGFAKEINSIHLALGYSPLPPSR